MGTPEDLWALTYATLLPKPHETPTQTLDRLVNERFADMPALQVNARTASIREELWPLERLRLLNRKHGRANPKREGGAIIAVECRGRKLLVDGNNRVNHWLASGNAGPHRIVVITVGDANAG